jgi:mRNA-degrading endonuclease RelE of RelBE toxin-antitoxin system
MTTNKKLSALLKKLPRAKAQEVLDFADFLASRIQSPKKPQRLGDRFAGVWKGDRSAEEIIADIRESRMNTIEREQL